MSDKRVRDWLDERTNYRERLRGWLDSPLVGGPRWAAALGSLLGVCFAILALTGALLMTAYAPTVQSAWASVHYIHHDLGGGWLVRGLHHFASHALIVLCLVHIAQIVLTAAYRRPREIFFWLTLALFGLVMGLAITGHLLPWDQKGYWARRVEIGIVGLAPFGAWIQKAIQGGPDLGALALTRAYAAHVAVLPALFLVVLALRKNVAHRDVPLSNVDPTLKSPYFRQVSRNLVGAVALTAALFAFVWRTKGAPLDAPADPMSDYPARPEWFLLPMFQLRKYFHGAGELWGTIGVPALGGLYLFALPLIDKARGAKLRDRLGVLAPFAAFGAGMALLALLAVRNDARDPKLQKEIAIADQAAQHASVLAEQGVPPTGPLDMLHNDPEYRGGMLFQKHCASCHVLGELGDPNAEKGAATLDGWGTEKWIRDMIHAPDAPDFFGRTKLKGEMPSVDAPQPTEDEPHPKPMIKSKESLDALAVFLAAQGDEPGDPPRAMSAETRAAGEKIVVEQCTSCHLWNGTGDDNGTGKAPELARYGSLAWTRAQIANPGTAVTYREHGGSGEKGLMPRFDGDMSPVDIEILARWTRARTRGTTFSMPKAADIKKE